MATPTTAAVAAWSPDKVAGGIAYLPPGTALPTDASTALPAAAVALGYVSEDGIADASDAASTDDTVAWGGDVVATLTSTKRVARFTAKLLGVLDSDVLQYTFGDDQVTVTAATESTPTKIAVAENGTDPKSGIIVITGFYGGKLARIVVPNASAILNSEDPMVHSAVSGLEVQVTCLPDELGNVRYRYYELDDATG
ncbi:MAG: hypothetical protein QM638_01255 [Nocardioides sp.]|uniref:phage tail tube protein n=1 Tax=Nocardioides sp. TaxID=35761 RepID=UPI0039E4DD76